MDGRYKRRRTDGKESKKRQRKEEAPPPAEPDQSEAAPAASKPTSSKDEAVLVKRVAQDSPASPVTSTKAQVDSTQDEQDSQEESQGETGHSGQTEKPIEEKEKEIVSSQKFEEPNKDDCTVMFSVHRTGSIEDYLSKLSDEGKKNFEENLQEMIKTVEALIEAGGSSSVDEKLTANASFLLSNEIGGLDFAVLKSNIEDKKKLRMRDVCIVTKFEASNWAAEYVSVDKEATPSLDVPAIWFTYKAIKNFTDGNLPKAVLSGNVVKTREMAEKIGITCTEQENKSSGPHDVQELIDMYKEHLYPKEKVFIRQGKGFIILADSIQKASEEFEAVIVPNL